MKRIILSILVLCMCQASALAATIKVKSMADFTTAEPLKTLDVTAVTDLLLEDGEIVINEGYLLKGDIVDVKSPKRLKRDASFAFILREYVDNNGRHYKINDEKQLVKGKFTTKFDYKGTAKTAALSVGNFFVKGISSAYATVEGAIKNEEGNRFKSGAVSLYESTPISYVEKGEDIVIKKNQVFILNFKVKEPKSEEPNYEYKNLNNSSSDIKNDTVENSEEVKKKPNLEQPSFGEVIDDKDDDLNLKKDEKPISVEPNVNDVETTESEDVSSKKIEELPVVEVKDDSTQEDKVEHEKEAVQEKKVEQVKQKEPVKVQQSTVSDIQKNKKPTIINLKNSKIKYESQVEAPVEVKETQSVEKAVEIEKVDKIESTTKEELKPDEKQEVAPVPALTEEVKQEQTKTTSEETAKEEIKQEQPETTSEQTIKEEVKKDQTSDVQEQETVKRDFEKEVESLAPVEEVKTETVTTKNKPSDTEYHLKKRHSFEKQTYDAIQFPTEPLAPLDLPDTY